MTVLFVCDCNAVVSPMAEAIAAHLAPQHEFWSAGVRPTHVRPEVRAALEEEGIPVVGLRAKGFGAVPLDEVDVVVTLVPEVRVPSNARRVAWALADPSSAPESERMEAYRATRDELLRRVGLLLRELA